MDISKVVMAIGFRSWCQNGHQVDEITVEGLLVEMINIDFPGASPSIVQCPTCGEKLGNWHIAQFVDGIEVECLPVDEHIKKYDELGRQSGPEHN